MKVAKNYRFYMGLAIFGFTFLAATGFGFFSFYLDEYASSFGEAFSLQNSNLLESGAVLELGSRLEATKKTGTIECIWATSNNRIFYQFGSSKCQTGVFGRTIEVTAKGYEGVSILFRVSLPWKVQIAFLGFIILNILVVLFVIFWIRSYEAIKLKTQAELSSLAQQVAHDIRSPLTALNMVMGAAKELPEEKRILIRNAVQRINDIANNLLEKSKTQNAEKATNSKSSEKKNSTNSKQIHTSTPTTDLNLNTHLLSSLIDTIVSEKRIQYRDKINVHIEADLNQAYGLFARINSQEFQRVLSNLINNSVESLLDGTGEVKVSVRGYANTVLVVVFDNGKGIPPHILEKLGEVGVSYGKEGTQSGSGLGVAHAKKAIESFGGKFEIQSRAGEGTMINIALPREPTPKWFVEKIRLNPDMQLVSVDDDVSIHQVWSGRFQSLHISEIVKHLSFTSTKSFMDWFNAQAADNAADISDILFLVDYEFLNETMTGLDLIEKLNIGKQAILITSRFEEPQIRARCDKAGIKLIPKSMAGLVPIEIEKQKKKLNAILIDDDTLVHMTWNSFAKENNKKYALYFSVESFLKEQSLYNYATPIYVDSNLGNGIKGEEAAKDIFALGFKNIFIATGYEASSIATQPWVKGVVGKEPQ